MKWWTSIPGQINKIFEVMNSDSIEFEVMELPPFTLSRNSVDLVIICRIYVIIACF